MITSNELKPNPCKNESLHPINQRYQEIIANSKNPVETEKALRESLWGIMEHQLRRYTDYLAQIESGTVPKGYENHYQSCIDKYKPVIEAEEFISERRQKAIAGEFETELEIGVYVRNWIKLANCEEYEYYDSLDYNERYEKIKAIIQDRDVPLPLSGIIPSQDLKQVLKPGDKLFHYEEMRPLSPEITYATKQYHIRDGGTVVKVNIKNVKTKINSLYMGEPLEIEASIPLNNISHVIRDGNRYRID